MNGTVVVRAGSYHEGFVLPAGKRLTVQNAPSEEVWFDGSRVLTGWRGEGATWFVENWTVRFDHSPTYTRGAPDNTQKGFAFLDPGHPMAAHPDQVFVDGRALRQVGAVSQVISGTFFVDEVAHRLYLGSDPAGHEVRASDLNRGALVKGAGATLRGISFRRFAPSVPDAGAVRIEAGSVALERMAVEDSATIGIAVSGPGATLRQVSSRRSGMLGIGGNRADGLVVEAVDVEDNNTERFNQVPVAGGMKFTKTRGIVVRSSRIADNFGTALWIDESCFDVRVIGSDMLDNHRHGLVLELSAKATVVDNLIRDNGRTGVLVSGTSDVAIWNNTLVGNGSGFLVIQDRRRASDLDIPGHDSRRQLPDPTVTWLTGPVGIMANVVVGKSGAEAPLLSVTDTSGGRSAHDMHVTANANLYHAEVDGEPDPAFAWSMTPGRTSDFATLSDFRQSSGQDANSVWTIGSASDPLHPDGTLTVAGRRAIARMPERLPPADVAAALDPAAGTSHVGVLR